MKIFKKIIVMIILFCICVTTKPVLAETILQDGLEVTLTSDKEEYTKEDIITTNITITNKNNFTITGIYLENVIPENYKLTNESLSNQFIENLDSGESITLTVTYMSEFFDEICDSENNSNNSFNILSKFVRYRS